MKEVISQVNLQTQIGKLALAIKKYESRTDTPIVFVGILNGAFMFFSDLVKKVDIPMEVDFVRVKSYEGQERKEIQFIKDLFFIFNFFISKVFLFFADFRKYSIA